MKKTITLTVALLFTTFLYSQTVTTPFQKLGYDVFVGTSSKGEYAEFHDLTDVVEIGSVLYNTKTKEIVQLLDEGESTLALSSATTAMSIDPHCEKYYWISPYAYAANNPILYVDPDGKDFHISFSGTNAEESRRIFEQISNVMFNNQFALSLTETSKGSGVFDVKINATKGGGDMSKLSENGRNFYNGMDGVIKNKEVTSISGVYASSNVNTGNFETGQVDFADINQFPDMDHSRKEQTGPTKQGKFMHELREQYAKTLGTTRYDKAHGIALGWEDDVNGNTRDRNPYEVNQTFWRTDRSRSGAFLYKTKLSTWQINTKSPVVKVKRVD